MKKNEVVNEDKNLEKNQDKENPEKKPLKKQKNGKKVEKSSKKQKNNENIKKSEPTKKKKSKGFVWFISVSAVAVVCLLVCQFFFENSLTTNSKFYENTKINGIDVSNMTMAEAENVVLTDMLNSRNEIEINLKNGDKEWKLKGTDFEVTNKIQPYIKEIASYGKTGNFFQNLKKEQQIKNNGLEFQVSYKSVLGNFDDKMNEIIEEVERPMETAKLVFCPNEEKPFKVDGGKSSVLVLRDELYNQIDQQLKVGKVANVEIPIVEITPEFDEKELLNSVVKRSEFSTSYETSSAARKNNVKRAIESFNGLIVESGQTISFNEITGKRTEENGYKSAHIIVGGVYVDGVGGGVCQASTTLYNALIRAGIQIDKVFHHSLPASYVPLSFDAMVSGSYSDLVFTNNLDKPIYIKTKADDKTVKVEIYGQDTDGVTIETRAELVKVLPHNGDKIVPDTKGEYANRILYKGEYLRVKWPKEGYESKGYLRYYKDGELIEEKEIRHDYYHAQDGVVMEGVEDIGVGMTLPASDVKICSPQKVTKQTEESVRAKLEKQFPSSYNP